ncbi:MAG: hypothetical protein ACLUTU_14450 [Blautia faecis]
MNIGTSFWAWNCKITKELIDSQLDCFEKMGFGGAHLHARTGLETDYLGEEFLNLVRYTDEEMKRETCFAGCMMRIVFLPEQQGESSQRMWITKCQISASYQGTQGKYVCFPGKNFKEKQPMEKACRLLCVCLSCVDSGRISEIL